METKIAINSIGAYAAKLYSISGCGFFERLPLNEHRHAKDSSNENDELAKELDKPIDLLPKSALPYHPLVSDSLDVLVDLSVGVVVGRSDSFHRKYQNSGLGMIGAITESSDDVLTSLLGLPVNLDLISPHVMLVAGKRGSGKSYTLGIIAEEIARAMERREIEVAAVLIDTVDVFRQSVEPNTDQEDLLKKWNLEARGFPVSVYIPRRTYAGLPDEVKKKARLYPLAISPRELTSADWGYILEKGGQLSTSMDNLMGDILESLRKGYVMESGEKVSLKRDFSITDMIRCIESNPSILELYQPSTRTAMIQRLRRADRLGVFHPGGTSAQDLAVAGQISIIDVAPLGSDADTVLAILTNMLCRQVLTYRMAWTDEGTSAREELPPTWLIVDEAHTLVPKTGSTPAKEAIIGYAKLGRRFGCSLILCTQQPSAVADEAISQADIIISHSLSHDNDIRALQQRAPAVMPNKFRDKVFISSLPRGVGIVFDQSTENKRGFLVQVRPRISQHGGTDRLSALFEAVRMMIPDDVELEEVESDEEVIPEGEQVVDYDEALEDDLLEIPRPPVKLSKDDWGLLDSWMKDYVEALFERRMQEFSITDDPGPQEVDEIEEIPEVPIKTEYAPANIDGSEVLIRHFGPVTQTLLEKAVTRKVLYSASAHEHLFSGSYPQRESVAICRDDVEPRQLVEMCVKALGNAGMEIDSVKHEEGFSFVLFRKNSIRGALSAGASGLLACVGVTLVGENRKDISGIMSKVRKISAS
ncbi:MAG: ATP-binding protein [Candidatus Hodarchaeota archaeon]